MQQIALCVCIYLVIANDIDNLCNYIQSNSPSGASLNALGTYILVSLSYVIGTMIEFAIVILIHRRSSETSRPPPTDPLFSNHIDSINPEVIQVRQKIKNLDSVAPSEKQYSYTEKIDAVAFFVFMISYCVFNFAYFFSYM